MDNRLTAISEPTALRRSCLVVAALLMIPCVGCGDATFVPVRGQVSLDGKPVAECAVMFIPVADGPAATGTTNAEGRFQVAATNRDDVAVGDYIVTIMKQRTTVVRNDSTGNSSLRIEWQIPQKYSQPNTSGIRRSVSSESCDFSFELSSK